MKENTVLTPPRRMPETVLHCYHCQEACPDDRLQLDDKHFCCAGCQMVYQILQEADLCQYYRLDEARGVSVRERRDARAYAWLDDEEVRRKLIRFSDGQTARVEFYLPQMHCASCIWLLEHLYKLDAGILHSKVNFLKKTVTVHYDETQTGLRQIAAMLAGIGYPPEINLGDVSEDARPRAVDRALYYKIGVAGFAFGNIMLLSFPEYLGLEKSEDSWFFQIFGYLNLLIATPVLLYSARDYLISAWNGLRHGHLNIDVPLSLGILALYGRSVWEIVGHTGAGYMDSFAGLIFFLLTGKWFQQKTFHHLSFERDYKSYFPVAATVRRNDTTEEAVPVQRLHPGDLILIRHGELIPADGILLKGEAQVDYSFVTGEADPVSLKSGDQIFAGGKQLGATIEISLTRRVSTSYLTQLWNDEAFKSKTKSQVGVLADRAGRYFTTLILLIAFAALAWWAPRDLSVAINAFTAVLIIACPCAVALAIPFTMGNILRLLGYRQFYVKNTQVVEGFSNMDAVVLDKTGTITNVSQNAVRFHNLAPSLPGALRPTEQIAVKTLTRQSNHPLSRQIFESMPQITLDQVEDFEEEIGKGLRGSIAGRQIRLGSADFITGQAQEEKGVFLEIDGVLRGYFEIKNRYRDGLEDLLAYFRQQGKKVWLLSGDNDREAAPLRALFPEPEAMRFNQSPQDKLAFIRALQAEGKKVLMLGDGLNDAGALQQSDIGIVVTENTNNFTPACDAILHADAFARLPKFFNLSKWGVATVNRAYLLAGMYNIVGLSYAVTGTLSPVVAAILMPLSALTIVLFGIGSTELRNADFGLRIGGDGRLASTSSQK
jgi:Cu+-exporting ATPase